jgi:hypothetical protein
VVLFSLDGHLLVQGIALAGLTLGLRAAALAGFAAAAGRHGGRALVSKLEGSSRTATSRRVFRAWELTTIFE